jgi:hypothetical protein
MNTQDALNRINLGKCEIVREYNNAVDDYNDVYNYCRDYSLNDECLKKLVGIGESLYEIYEKTMKYVIFKTYYEKTQDGSMAFSDFEQQVVNPLDNGSKSSLFNIRLTIKNLCIWMAQYASPQLYVLDKNGVQIPSLLPAAPVTIPQTEIDTALLQGYAGDAHNNNKHRFDYSADAKLLQICEQIFPHIEGMVTRYVRDDCAIKKYGITIYSSIHEIDKRFNAWNPHSIYKYVLIVDDMKLPQSELKILASLPWAMVIDFDSSSQKSGLLKAYMSCRKSPIILTPSATNRFDLSVIDTFWIFPNGRQEEPQYLVNNDNQWRRIARRNFQKLIEEYHAKVDMPLKILVLDKSYAERTGELLLDFVDEYQGLCERNNIDIVSLTNNVLHGQEKLKTFQNEALYSYFDVKISDLANYIKLNIITLEQISEAEHKVPVRGTIRKIDTSSYSTFTVLDLDIARREENDYEKINKIKFYLGETKISWYGVQHQFPIEWTEYYDVLHTHKEPFGSVKSPLKIILHEPGAGGSTFLRMYAYERSKIQPTIMLEQYSLLQTTAEIERFYLACDKASICICADSSDLSFEQCLELKDAIDALSLSHDFIYVHRLGIQVSLPMCVITELRDDTLKNMKKQLFELMDQIDEYNIKRVKEERKTDIEFIVSSSDRLSDRMPLIMSLYAFEDEYKGTKEYIHNFLKNLNESQKKELLYAAVIDEYAGEMLKVDFFTERHEEKLKYGKKYYLFNGTNGESISEKLFVFEEKMNGIFSKIKHPQFSRQIIDELLERNNSTNTKFYSNLVDCICDLIAFCARPETKNSESMENLLGVLFITKNKDELAEIVGKRYFGIIVDNLREEIENSQTRVYLIGRIFSKLTEMYPNNPHFEAHYGRYYGIIAHDSLRGMEHAYNAIKIAEKDDEILYHILATRIRHHIRTLITEYKQVSEGERKNKETEILKYAEEASKYYELSRKNKSQAGYISDIELCIMLVDFGTQKNNCPDYRIIAKNEKSEYHEYYERALALYRAVRSNEVMIIDKGNMGDKLSEIGKKIELLLLNLEETISYWSHQIQREKNRGKLIINRSLWVQATLRCKKGNIAKRELEQCINYMETNLDYAYRYTDLEDWFTLITMVHQAGDYNYLMEKDNKIREWIERYGDILELYYYIYLIDSLLALGRYSSYSANIRGIAKKMNSLTTMFKGNTIPRRILTGNATQLKDLMVVTCIDEGVRESAMILEGIVDSGKLKSGKPQIDCNGIPVYFNANTQHLFPQNRPGEKVQFKMLYSFQGSAALDNSVIKCS